MKQELTGFNRFKAILAKWIVINVAMRISPLSVLSLCLEVSNKYHESIEVVGE
jgi:hypothetical protein